MSSTIDLRKPNRKLHIGVILMGGTTELLDVAPVDLFTGMSEAVHEFPDELFPPELKKQALDIEHHRVNETGHTAQLTAGLRIQPTDSFATCPPLDIVIMGAHNFKYEPNEKELAFVRKSYDDCSAFIAICGGFQAGMQAGLFNGKTVAVPAPAVDMVKQVVPSCKVEKRRWQRDGKLWTSGMLLNGLDAMRAFGEQTYGGPGTLMEKVLEAGSWPVRNVYYADDVKA